MSEQSNEAPTPAEAEAELDELLAQAEQLLEETNAITED